MKNRVKEERKKKNWSQLDLSIKTRINQGDISQIETGKIFPYPGWRKRIAKALEVNEEYLFPSIKEAK